MPTPVEHYERAEDYLAQAEQAHDPLHAYRLTTRAGVHARLAAVAWGADDRVLDEVAAGLDAEQVGALIAVVDELDRMLGDAGLPGIPVGVDAEAWVAGYQTLGRAVELLVKPVAREVLAR